MRSQEVYAGWQEKRLTQEDAGQLLGVSGRTFRRQIGRFEKDGVRPYLLPLPLDNQSAHAEIDIRSGRAIALVSGEEAKGKA